MNYNSHVIEVQESAEFRKWLEGLSDDVAKKKIAMRIVRLGSGLFGDVKFFEHIGELRVDSGPGYRIYFISRGATIIILLCGGDKSTQQRDIKSAIAMAKET